MSTANCSLIGSSLDSPLPPTPKRSDVGVISQADMIMHACAGTLAAGALYGPTLLLVGLLTGSRLPLGNFPVELLLLAIFSSLLGIGLTMGVVIPVAIMAILFGAVWGAKAHHVWYGSLVGGWTGFLCTHWTFGMFIPPGDYFLLVGLGVVMGQVGAAAAAHKLQQVVLSERPPEPLRKDQIGLRQLFGVTTSLAVIAAILGGFELPAQEYRCLGFAVLVQAAVLGAAALLHRRPAARPTGPTGLDDPVPRENSADRRE
jgi:hypothetical protein